MNKWEDISDILTVEGAAKLNPGEVLIFDYEGSPINLKIMRMTRGKVWAKRLGHLYTEEEMRAEVTVENKKKHHAIRPHKNI